MNVVSLLKEGMAEVPVFNRFPNLKDSLQQGILTETTIVAMVDLSPFSDFVAASSADEVRGLLQGYYEDAVSIIEEQGGVVEKYIGDAVVSLFGAPFNGQSASTKSELHKAFDASLSLIDKVHDRFGGDLQAKCAIHVGPCFVGFVGPQNHAELTVVGTPLTGLFRLEEIAAREAVIMQSSWYSNIEDMLPIAKTPFEAVQAGWVIEPKRVTLRGVGEDIAVTQWRRRRS